MNTSTTRVWSEQQQAIFNWFAAPADPQRPGPRHLVVRARAGTGKTTTIIQAISHAWERRILLCAFNKRIQEELQGRLRHPGAEAKTLHSVGFACVRRAWSGIGLDRNGERADRLTDLALDSPELVPDAIKRLITKLHSKAREIMPHASRVGQLSDLSERFECVPDEGWWYRGYDGPFVEAAALRAMATAVDRQVAFQTGIDFADMIYLPVRCGWLQKQYDMVVVDEAQDMTAAQLEIAQGVCRGRIVVVGDDRQAIYGFRGADSNSLDRLKEKLGADELGLTRTYRCGKRIVELAAELVPDFEADESCPDGELRQIVSTKLVEELQHGDFMLSRFNAPLVTVAMACLREQKRARIAGRDIGAGLKSLIRKLRAGTVSELMTRVAEWEQREIERLSVANREHLIAGVQDRAATLIELASGADTVREIEQRIDALFTDDGLGQAGVITCSSVHRAKGLEANRVFVLEGTLRGHSREEENIRYVAYTRAKQALTLVSGRI